MDVTPITETTGIAIAMRTSEVRSVQREISDLLAAKPYQSLPCLTELNRRIVAIYGEIEEPPF